MKILGEGEQLNLFGPDTEFGRMCPEPSPAANQRARTSASSSKSSAALRTSDYMFLDLRAGAGNLLGPCWEINALSLGEYMILNTGPAPHSGAAGSTLSQILEDTPLLKYYLSSTACSGILRRTQEREKILPPALERALILQSMIDVRNIIMGATEPQSDVLAFAANQRDEVRDLHNVAGALQSQPGMKQQTFVICGSVPNKDIFAFHINQREETIDLEGISGALMATRNMQMQTFVAQTLNPWDTQQSRISMTNGVSPTLAGADGGGGRNPAGLIFCLNDQGGQIMSVSENIAGTLRTQMKGHQPLVLGTLPNDSTSPLLFENHGMDCRFRGPLEIAPTIQASYGTGGNNTSLVSQPQTYCLAGNIIDRQPENGGNGTGCQEGVCYTITTSDRHAVYQKTVGALCRGDEKGVGNQYVSQDKCIIMPNSFVRRLTPLECERLQGFPDFWTDIPADGCRPGASDTARYKALGNSVAIPCVEHVLRGVSYFLHIEGGGEND